jgi:uncharacterized membrane protein YidH (DUF202 family)
MPKYVAICFPGQTQGQQQCVTPPNQVPRVDPETIMRNAMTILIITAVILVVIYIMWGGVRWIMSRGDKQQIQGARNNITYALIGLVVVFLAFFLVSIIGYLFGVQIF